MIDTLMRFWKDLSGNRKEIWILVRVAILLLFLGIVLEMTGFNYSNLMTLIGGVIFLYIIAKRSQAMIENNVAEIEQGRNNLYVRYLEMINDFEISFFLESKITNTSIFTAAVLGLDNLVGIDLSYKKRVETIFHQLLQKLLSIKPSSSDVMSKDHLKHRSACCSALINILYNKATNYDKTINYDLELLDHFDLRNVIVHGMDLHSRELERLSIVNSRVENMSLTSDCHISNSIVVAYFDVLKSFHTKFKDVDFSNSVISNGLFRFTEFTECGLRLKFQNCEFAYGKITKSYLDFSLEKTKFDNVEFQTCKLPHDFPAAAFKNCNFHNCLMSTTTRERLTNHGNVITGSEDQYSLLKDAFDEKSKRTPI